MNDRKKPLKPARNPGHWVFPKEGPVRRIIEEFPRVQEDIEFTVGKKFLGSLNHFKNIYYENLRTGDEPADLVCSTRDGSRVNIQVVEVVDRQLRQLQRMRSSYREALLMNLGEEIMAFNGCRVSLVDSGDPPYLPAPDSNVGQDCLEILLKHIRNVASDIHTLEVGKIRSRSTMTANPARKIGMIIERKMVPANPARLEFHWEGSGPSYRVDISRGLLSEAVQTKIDKSYAKPRDGTFILLVYSIDSLITKDDPDVIESKRLLETNDHPFDEIWYIYPYAERKLGSIFRIWPNDEWAN